MGKINQTELLKQNIAFLEIQRNADLVALKEQFHTTYESLKPMNMLKSAFKGMTDSSEAKGGIGGTLMGIASGFLAKKMLFRSSHNPLAAIARIALQSVVTNVVANNSEKIKESGKSIFHTLLSAFMANRKKHNQKEPEFCEKEF